MSDIRDLVKDFQERLKNLDVTINEDLEQISTRVEIIDIFSGGGFPVGGFILIVGDPATSKTLLVTNLIKGLQESDERALSLYIDAETALTQQRLQQLGIDINRLLLIRHVTVEKVYEIIQQFLQFKAQRKMVDVPSFIVWDSIATTPVEKQMAGAEVDSAIGLKARQLSYMLPTLCARLERYKTSLIAINQFRQKVQINQYQQTGVNVKGLENKELPGGTVQYYQASLLLKLENAGLYNTTGTDLRKEDISAGKNINGFVGYLIRGIFLKNKYAMPNLPFYFVVDPVRGVSEFWTRYEYLKKFNIIKQAGGWYTLVGFDKKFRWKEAENLYNENDAFKNIFDEHWEALKIFIELYAKDPARAKERYREHVQAMEQQLKTEETKIQEEQKTILEGSSDE